MLVIERCDDLTDWISPYADGELESDECAAIDEHLFGCMSCREKYDNYCQMNGLMVGAFDDQSGGAAAVEQELAQEEFQGEEANGEEVYDEEEMEKVPFFQGASESIADVFRAAPWWMISGSFHVLLIMLVVFIGMTIMGTSEEEIVIVAELEKPKPPEEREPVKRDVFEKPENIQEMEEVVEENIIVHEEVEIAEIVETADDSDAEEAIGEDGLTDIFMGGSGTIGSIGVGGGGAAGAFGRPMGRGGRLRRATKGGGSKKTESAVDAALAWLARHQKPDGSWEGRGKATQAACAGYALLAFLGAGHTEKIGKYKANVKLAVQWLISQQKDSGAITNGYAHAITGMALAEAGAMARIPATLEAAQKSVTYSTEVHQAGKGSERGGWRYKPKQKGDLSVTGWFVMQLKSAKVAGLQVEPASFDGAATFLDRVEKKGGVKVDESYGVVRTYGYTGPGAKKRTTAIGLLCRQFMGWKKEELEGGVRTFIPKSGGPTWGPKADFYFWYYGTLCTFQQGGEVWKGWNDGLKGALVPNQRKGGPMDGSAADVDGSWDMVGHFSKKWGRVGQTAIGALCLEVYYRYLPMLRE